MIKDKMGRNWFKGNLHTHTTVSDGKYTPEQAYELYKSKGYDFIARTDHWKSSLGDRYEGLLILPGEEFDVGSSVGEGIFHIVGVGFEEEPKLVRGDGPQKIIDQIHTVGGVAILAHPAWSLNTPDQLMQLKNVDMSEIYNSVSGVPFNCRPYSGLIFDMMAARGCLWRINAADDVHFYTEHDACRSYVMVQAEECTQEAIVEALKKGHFYATQGPELSVTYVDGKVKVECSPVEEIVYYTDTVFVHHRCQMGTDLTEDEYVPASKDTFVRVEVKDKTGRYAWGQYVKV